MNDRTIWRRVTPVSLLVIAGGIGAIQVLLLPIKNTSVTIQAVTETALLIVVVIGLFLIPNTTELTRLPSTDADSIYPPILLGLGLFTIRAITDVLDEFLAHPTPSLAVLEDGTMILGLALLLLGLYRWTRIQQQQEQTLLKQQDRLETQNDRLDSFASVVSHDLRNPLNVAQGRIELAREEHDSDHLQFVAQAHQRMEALIDDLLILAREGEAIAETERIEVRNLSEICWNNVETAEATLVIETDHLILADRSRLQQILENLFRNAVEHGGQEVTVTVGDFAEGFYVEDDGPGIDSDVRPQIFNPGYSTDKDGTGFGLPIVKEIVEAHGWQVQVGEAHNGGARFEFSGIETA